MSENGLVLAWTPNTEHFNERIKAGEYLPGVRVGRRDGWHASAVTGWRGQEPIHPSWVDMPEGKRPIDAARVLGEFLCVVVRDKVPVMEAHREFLKVPAYAAALSEDTPGSPERGGLDDKALLE